MQLRLKQINSKNGMFSFDLLLAVLTILILLVFGSYFISLLDNKIGNRTAVSDKQTKLLLISNKLIRRELVARDFSSFYTNVINPLGIQKSVSPKFIGYHNLSYLSISSSDLPAVVSVGKNHTGNKFCIRRVVLLSDSGTIKQAKVSYLDICVQ